MPVLRQSNKGAQALRHCLVCPGADGLPEALAESLVPMKTDLFADLSAVSGDRKIVQQAQAHIGRALVSGWVVIGDRENVAVRLLCHLLGEGERRYPVWINN